MKGIYFEESGKAHVEGCVVHFSWWRRLLARIGLVAPEAIRFEGGEIQISGNIIIPANRPS